jgi:hypothetical protein
MPKKQSVRMLYKRFSRTGDTFLAIPFLKKWTFSTATPFAASTTKNDSSVRRQHQSDVSP